MTTTNPAGVAHPPSLTKQDALVRARTLAEAIVERRAETEALRRLPDSTIADLLDSGLMRINQSAYWGGSELGTEAAVEIVAEVARGDGAVGWVFGLLASHFWLICLFPPEAQEEVWGSDPSALMSSSFAPSEAACERVDGGYQISGRWPWSSGSNHCQWAMVGFTLPPAGPDEAPQIRWGLVPRDSYKVDDDWWTVGMRGTGSNAILIEDAFVPDHRCIDPWDVAEGKAPGAVLNASPMFRLPFAAALGHYLAASALGAAEATFDDWVSYMAKKRQAFTGDAVGRQQTTLIRAGQLAAQLHAARVLMTDTTRWIDAHIEVGPLDQEMRLRGARDATFAMRLCVDTVDTCMQFAGGSALFESHPVQKGWRDVHAISAHAGFNTDTVYGNYGHLLLGVPLVSSPML